MPRRTRNSPAIPVPTWRCPNCGHVHTPADTVRADTDNYICKSCGSLFPAGRSDAPLLKG